jgi:hypothetical protein
VKLPTYKWNSCTALSNRNVIENAEVSIAPNPAEGQFVVRLENSKITQIIVSGIDGRVVRTLNSNANVETVNVNGLMGVYFVNITDQLGRTTTQKVVLK